MSPIVQEPVQRSLDLLAELRLAYDLVIRPAQLPAAVAVAREHPATRFVLDHIAKPRMAAGPTDPEWERYMARLAELPNVWCKLSGLVTEADWKNWKKEDFRPYLDVVFGAFGPKRLMFGSDWPVCLLAASYQQVLEIIEDYVQDCAADIKEKIFGGNASDFYQLKAAKRGLAA